MRLAKGTQVRVSDEWLAKLEPNEARRYAARLGTVEGYRLGAHEPIVLFPQDGRRKELKLFEFDSRRLVVVTEPDPD